MENTEKVQFKDDAPRWFVAAGDSWIGPLFATEVYKKVLSQEISWAHYIWTPGQTAWLRICDVEAFEASVPQKPGRDLLAELRGAVKGEAKIAAESEGTKTFSGARLMRAPEKSSLKRDWFLYYNDSQFGPFSREEVRRYLAVGKINERVHAWRDGMSDWARIIEIDDLRDAQGTTGPAIRRAGPRKEKEQAWSNQRVGPRKPMIARILLANGSSVISGVCRDISVGGMQVLCDEVPGQAGSHVKLNVSPTGPIGLEPFTAEGVIVRVLEDGRGFSFRFDNLAPTARDAIERYIQEGGQGEENGV